MSDTKWFGQKRACRMLIIVVTHHCNKKTKKLRMQLLLEAIKQHKRITTQRRQAYHSKDLTNLYNT